MPLLRNNKIFFRLIFILRFGSERVNYYLSKSIFQLSWHAHYTQLDTTSWTFCILNSETTTKPQINHQLGLITTGFFFLTHISAIFHVLYPEKTFKTLYKCISCFTYLILFLCPYFYFFAVLVGLSKYSHYLCSELQLFEVFCNFFRQNGWKYGKSW